MVYIGKFSFSFVIKMIWILTYGAQLETTTFQFEPADYLYMLLFGAASMMLSSAVLHQYFYGNSIIFMLLVGSGLTSGSSSAQFQSWVGLL